MVPLCYGLSPRWGVGSKEGCGEPDWGFVVWGNEWKRFVCWDRVDSESERDQSWVGAAGLTGFGC